MNRQNILGLLILGVVAGWQPSFAVVNFLNNLRNIYYLGPHEHIGSIAIRVEADDFWDASPGNPVFVKVSLDANVAFAETLVLPTPTGKNSSRSVQDPIYLAAGLIFEPSGYVINMMRTAVALVRLVEGEHAFWLKITQSSSTWVWDTVATTAIPPSQTVPVMFYVGVTASDSWDRYAPLFDNQYANLPANVRDTSNPVQADAVDMSLFVDATGSTLAPFPNPGYYLSVLPAGYDATTQGVTTAVNENEIVPGGPSSAVFAGDQEIARGYELQGMPFSYFVVNWYVYLGINVCTLIERLGQ